MDASCRAAAIGKYMVARASPVDASGFLMLHNTFIIGRGQDEDAHLQCSDDDRTR